MAILHEPPHPFEFRLKKTRQLPGEDPCRLRSTGGGQRLAGLDLDLRHAAGPQPLRPRLPHGTQPLEARDDGLRRREPAVAMNLQIVIAPADDDQILARSRGGLTPAAKNDRPRWPAGQGCPASRGKEPGNQFRSPGTGHAHHRQSAPAHGRQQRRPHLRMRCSLRPHWPIEAGVARTIGHPHIPTPVHGVRCHD